MTNIAQKTNAPDYLQLLKGGVQFRMLRLRDRAQQTASLPPSMRAATWREARKWGFHNWQAAYATLSQGYNTENAGTKWEKRTPVWYCHTGEQFRDERDAHECDGGPRHTGWFCNDDQSNKCVGIIGRLHHGLFIIGYRLTDSGERVYFNSVCHSEDEAARSADMLAQAYAEEERDYNERFLAAAELRQSITDKLEDIGPAFALRNHARHGEKQRALVYALAAEVRTMQERLTEEFADIEV